MSAQQAQKNVKESAAQLRDTGKAENSGKKGGPLSWLGLGQDTLYADDN